MRLHIYDIKQTEKVVYVHGVRIRKVDNKYDTVPITVSFKPSEFFSKVKTIKFPFKLDVKFEKGVGATINEIL